MSADTTVILTGGSAGIGLAIARRCLAEGRRVINLSRRACPAAGVEHIGVDLSEASAVAQAMAQLKERIQPGSRLHLIHNAASAFSDSANQFDVRACERAMRLNVVTPAELTAGLLPYMTQGSSVIFIGSTLSEKGVPGRYTYVTSKHALLGLMRATAQDLFGSGIHTVCVCPGFVDTDLLEGLRAQPEALKSVLNMVSYGRLLTPDEIADVVAFTLEHPAVNGSVIHANLGQREA